VSVESPFAGSNINYAAPVSLKDGSHAVLKLWVPFEDEFRAEVEALRLYKGDGSVRLLDVDFEKRAMLLERAEPGTDLWQLDDEDKQIEITAAIMRRLWRRPEPDSPLPRAWAQFERMALQAPAIAPRSFPLDWVVSAKAIIEEVGAAAEPVVLHEDLHQANILRAEREPWLAIDPHGLIGPREFDTIQMILNVLWREKDHSAWPRIISRYVDQLSERLGLDRERVRQCGVARGVQEAFWTLEDHGQGWEKDFAIVEAFEAAR
jgi:streptomycin 6-kinase